MKTNYEIRYAAHPEDAKSYDTARLRRDFLIEKVFTADEVNMVYSMYVTVKYIQKSDRAGYVKLVSQNQHHADKDVEISRIRAIALVKASIRMNSIR